MLTSNYHAIGTESETVPSVAPAGKQVTLACPDEKTYFKWLNKTTSAQYYVNNKGVDYKKACRWGEPGSTSGNYAPLNLGIGSDIFSVYWLSILPNSPTTNETLDFNVKIDGPDIAMKCKYENGKFYSNGVETPAGCTVSALTPRHICQIMIVVLTFHACRRPQPRAKLTTSSIEETEVWS